MKNLSDLSKGELESLSAMLNDHADEKRVGAQKRALEIGIAAILDCDRPADFNAFIDMVSRELNYRQPVKKIQHFGYFKWLDTWDYVAFYDEPTKEKFLKSMGRVYDSMHGRVKPLTIEQSTSEP